MIPQLTDFLDKLGPSAVLVPLLLSALSTVVVFLASSIAEWFRDRNP